MTDNNNPINQEAIEILIEATRNGKINWWRMADYSFWCHNNGGMNQWIDLCHLQHPKKPDDIPAMDIMYSYYCKFGEVSFALCRMTKVEGIFNRPKNYYDFKVQASPYQSLISFEEYQNEFEKLAQVAEISAHKSCLDLSNIASAIEELKDMNGK